MDALMNKGKAMLSGQHAGAGHSGAGMGAHSGADQRDYVDKGLDAVEKKFGMQQSRNTNESITDGARGLFEKATGKKVSPKISN